MSKEQYKIWLNVFDNDVVALEPEMWANESLMIWKTKPWHLTVVTVISAMKSGTMVKW